MTSLCYQLIFPALSPGFGGLMHVEQDLAPKHSLATKDTFGAQSYLTPAFAPLWLRENMWPKALGSVPLPQPSTPKSLLRWKAIRENGGSRISSPSSQLLGEIGGQSAQRVSREAGCPRPPAPAATLYILQVRRDRSRKTSHGNYGISVFPLVKSDLPRTGVVGWPGCGQWQSS